MDKALQLTELKQQGLQINSQIKKLELEISHSRLAKKNSREISIGSHSGSKKYSKEYLQHRASRALCGLAPNGPIKPLVN